MFDHQSACLYWRGFALRYSLHGDMMKLTVGDCLGEIQHETLREGKATVYRAYKGANVSGFLLKDSEGKSFLPFNGGYGPLPLQYLINYLDEGVTDE